MSSRHMVTISAKDRGSFKAYLALPPNGTGPGLILLQDSYGVNQGLRELCDWYAERGFVVICPDLLWRQKAGVELSDRKEADRKIAAQLYKGFDEQLALMDIDAAFNYLHDHVACSGKIGCIGFSVGGKLAFHFAARGRPAACVSYYGIGIEGHLEEITPILSPLLMHIAEEDGYCPQQAQNKIRAAASTTDKIEYQHYAGLDHAFARPGGERFHSQAAELAHLRTIDFLVRHMVAPPTTMAGVFDDIIEKQFEDGDLSVLEDFDDDIMVNFVPVMTGGSGRAQIREFYRTHLLPKMPPDADLISISRTLGDNMLVDEVVFNFTHSVAMDWMLPGLPPTGKQIAVAMVFLNRFKDDKMTWHTVYWDQASVLVQLGLIDPQKLPVVGHEGAAKVMAPESPGNALLQRCQP